MNLLLDTCTFLWLAADPGQLSTRATSLLTDPANQLWLNVVSVWEVIQKNRIGKLPVVGDIGQIVDDQTRANCLRLLPVDYRHVLEGRALPRHHGDPFDRLLICQAIAEQLTIVTPDRKFHLYPIGIEW